MMSISATITSLSPAARLELFILDASAIGGGVYRFHAGTNKLNQPMVWQGETYLRLPVSTDGFEASTSGSLPRPTLSMANYTIDQAGHKIYGYMSAICAQYRDLQGARLVRKTTFAKYLDAANFPGNINPSADPTAELPDEIWYVDRKADEADEYIKWELAATLDLTNVKLPSRPIISNLCPATYKDAATGCTWSPDPETGPFFDVSGSATSAANDRCSKRLVSGCKVRFGPSAGLPFMGFPGAGLVQR